MARPPITLLDLDVLRGLMTSMLNSTVEDRGGSHDEPCRQGGIVFQRCQGFAIQA